MFAERIDIHISHFFMCLKKMTNYKIYLNVPTEPVLMDPQAYCLHVAQGKRQELLRLEERYKKMQEKYSKILDRLTWLNVCLSSLSVSSGISSVATLSTFIGLPVGIPLGTVSLAGVSISGIATVLTKKYQQNLQK